MKSQAGEGCTEPCRRNRRRQSASEGDGHWLRREQRTGPLVRSVHIGRMLNSDAVSPSLKDRVLEVQIPKHTSSEERTIHHYRQ